MFLATTGLTQFWKKDEELLLLGTWCMPSKREERWKDVPYRILSCPWDDGERIRRAVDDCRQVYEHMLHNLAAFLNDFHGVSHSVRYWRILIGPWLMHFCHVVYDRDVLLKNAFEQYPALQTTCLSPASFRTVSDTACFVSEIGKDLYNLQLFSQILTFYGYRFEEQPFSEKTETGLSSGTGAHLKRIVKGCGIWCYGLAAQRFLKSRRMLLCDLYVSHRDTWRLAIKTRLRSLPYYTAQSLSNSSGPLLQSFEKREALSNLPTTHPLERLLVGLLPVNFPILYLEGYAAAKEQVVKKHFKAPSAILTATGWYFNERFKFLAAASMECGTRLLGVQHGGGYGWARYMPVEQHEQAVCDRFYAWGWANGETGTENLPSPRLSAISRQTFVSRKKRDILFVVTNHPQYFYRLQSFPVGSQFDRYLAWQERFIAALPVHLRKYLVVRLYAEDYGRDMANRLRNEFPDIRFDTTASASKSLRSARLVVIDHNMTTMLETLAGDIPTVLFWDPLLWPIRNEAIEMFRKLQNTDIYHNSPEHAAKHIDQKYGQIMEWWNSEEVQSARSRFTTRYAQADANWPSIWSEKLISF